MSEDDPRVRATKGPPTGGRRSFLREKKKIPCKIQSNEKHPTGMKKKKRGIVKREEFHGGRGRGRGCREENGS